MKARIIFALPVFLALMGCSKDDATSYSTSQDPKHNSYLTLVLKQSDDSPWTLWKYYTDGKGPYSFTMSTVVSSAANSISPVLTPKGDKVIYSDQNNIYLKEVKTGEVILTYNLTFSPSDLTLSNDGSLIAYSFDKSVFVLNAVGGSSPVEIKLELDNLWDIKHMRFSPDGKSIVFKNFRSIYLLSIDTKVLTRISSIHTMDEEDSYPVFIPDGSGLVFQMRRYFGSGYSYFLVKTGIGTGAEDNRLLLGDTSIQTLYQFPAVAADGQTVYYLASSNEWTMHIYRTPINGGVVSEVAKLPFKFEYSMYNFAGYGALFFIQE